MPVKLSALGVGRALTPWKIPGTHLLEAESTPGMELLVLRKFKKSNDLIWN
jgi:hypothetical protein